MLAGLAGLASGAFSMAAGEYVSVRAQAELTFAEMEVECREIPHRPDAEQAELALLYERRGLEPGTRGALTGLDLDRVAFAAPSARSGRRASTSRACRAAHPRGARDLPVHHDRARGEPARADPASCRQLVLPFPVIYNDELAKILHQRRRRPAGLSVVRRARGSTTCAATERRCRRGLTRSATATSACTEEAPARVSAPASAYRGTAIPRAFTLPAAAFTDDDGGPFDLRRDTRKRVTLVFFGYTSCPDICPTTMADLALALRRSPIIFAAARRGTPPAATYRAAREVLRARGR